MTRNRSAAGRTRAARALAVVLPAVLALVAACGSTGPDLPVSASASSVVRAPDPPTGAVPAAPQGRPLLTLAGRIATTNAGGALRLDQAALDRLGLVALRVDDPWAKQRLDLQGFRLRDLVELAGPDAGATSLHLTAHDDYQVDLDLAAVRTDDVFLATRDGAGRPLPVEEGGPTRIVFADDAAGRFSADLWIWNIETIEVR
jgi:hypothetical protein